ncbi:MAG: TatD family hydrolase [Gemmatimonas sp.]
MLVDSHCHLDFPDFAEERADVIGRARAAGVGCMLSISTKLSTFPAVRAIAESNGDVFCTVGIHPHEADAERLDSTQVLVDASAHPRVVGIGETGLDYYYDHSDRASQQRVFRAHIAAARATQLPLVVHTRDADADMARILGEEYGQGAFPGLLHCFSSSQELAEAALAIGFYISFSGIVTFKNAESVRATARMVPRDRLLVETDAPYLAPVPNRGKRNEPAFVVHTARTLAELRGESADALAEATTANFFRLFAKAAAAFPERASACG